MIAASLLTAVSAALTGAVLVHGAAWTLLSALAIPRPRHRQPTAGSHAWRLAALVPAHNEEATIGDCVASLRASLLAAGTQPRIVVVADNCVDGTAARARAAGAVVLERSDQHLRGKPHALDFGLRWLAANNPPPAVLFVDGDSTVNAEFVTEVLPLLDRGEAAIQGYYTMGASETSFQRLRALALALVHWSRPLGASRLGLGTTLKGNGMVLRWELVESGFGAHGITEDAELTLALARRGVVVRFAPGAVVRGATPNGYGAARSQDERWEGGRLSLMRSAARTATREALRGRFRGAAAAAEVAALPLSLLVLLGLAALGTAVAAGLPPWPALVALGSLGAYVTVGLLAARPPLRDVMSLATAPRFLAYKTIVLLKLAIGRKPTGWERSNRV